MRIIVVYVVVKCTDDMIVDDVQSKPRNKNNFQVEKGKIISRHFNSKTFEIENRSLVASASSINQTSKRQWIKDFK